MNLTQLHNSIVQNIDFSFSRSSGAGGQNVNKVNTKVHAVIPLNSLEGLNQTELILLRQKLASYINKEGCLFMDTQEERTQKLNREIAVKKMEKRITAAVKINRKRIKTKPTKASNERRLKLKKIRSAAKNARRAKNWE